MNKVNALKNLPRTHPGLFWILVFTLLSRIAVYLIGQPWNQEVVEDKILDGENCDKNHFQQIKGWLIRFEVLDRFQHDQDDRSDD